MKIYTTEKLKIYPTEEQKEQINLGTIVYAIVYNYFWDMLKFHLDSQYDFLEEENLYEILKEFSNTYPFIKNTSCLIRVKAVKKVIGLWFNLKNHKIDSMGNKISIYNQSCYFKINYNLFWMDEKIQIPKIGKVKMENPKNLPIQSYKKIYEVGTENNSFYVVIGFSEDVYPTKNGEE